MKIFAQIARLSPLLLTFCISQGALAASGNSYYSCRIAQADGTTQDWTFSIQGLNDQFQGNSIQFGPSNAPQTYSSAGKIKKGYEGWSNSGPLNQDLTFTYQSGKKLKTVSMHTGDQLERTIEVADAVLSKIKVTATSFAVPKRLSFRFMLQKHFQAKVFCKWDRNENFTGQPAPAPVGPTLEFVDGNGPEKFDAAAIANIDRNPLAYAHDHLSDASLCYRGDPKAVIDQLIGDAFDTAGDESCDDLSVDANKNIVFGPCHLEGLKKAYSLSIKACSGT